MQSIELQWWTLGIVLHRVIPNNCSNSYLGHAIDKNLLNLSKPQKISVSGRILPYVFIGDDAFGLKNNMMKHYLFLNLSPEERIFTYRASRARRVTENAFGVAAPHFLVHRPINAQTTINNKSHSSIAHFFDFFKFE